MGLDYSYILYFDSEKQWEVLQAVADFSAPHHPPVKIIFPDHELTFPIETWPWKEGIIKSNDPEMAFQISMNFEEDEAIRDYCQRLDNEIPDRKPPDELKPRTVAIGYIYLSIDQYANENSVGSEMDTLVAFNFGTTGSRMSILFDESNSIRRKFVELLERIPGVCGVFNREESGKVFWYKGQTLDEEIPDPYLTPSEIKTMFGLNG